MKKTGVKLIASLLVFVLTFTYVSIMQEAVEAVAQSVQTQNENVEFDSYLVGDEGKTYAAIKKIGEENYLYAKVKVGDEGYLKDGTITLVNPNYQIAGKIESETVASVEGNVIHLNQVKNKSEQVIAIPIKELTGESVNENAYNNNSEVAFEGKYIDKNGKEKTVSNKITVGLAWDAERVVELNANVTKVVPYTNTNGKKYVAVQMQVSTKLANNTLPVKNEKIEILMPNIDNKIAEKVAVFANSTKQINGEEIAESFSEKNFVFNAETNTLTIEVENKADANGNIAWKKNAKDEYTITAIYNAENINLEANNTKVKYKVKSTLTASNTGYAEKEVEAEKVINNESVSDLVEFVVNTNVSKLSKAQIYANYNIEEKVETSYEEEIIANVTYAEMTDKIVINQKPDTLNSEGATGLTSVNGTNYAYIKSLKIDKENFNKILGEEGEIKVFCGNTLVARINKQETEEKAYKVDLSLLNINEMTIETTKPIHEGNLKLTVEKALKGDIGYSISQMRDFTKLQLYIEANSQNNIGIETQNAQITKQIELTEPETKAEITMDKTNLSTVVKNDNVKITEVLRTDSLDCRLYKDPTIKITFPSYIEEINVKDIKLYFETEGTRLTPLGSNLYQNTDGTKTLEIALEGTQTEYTLGAVSKGINVVIISDILVNKLTANKEDVITMTYTNNYIEPEEKAVNMPINIVAPVGVVAVSTVSGYAEGASPLTAISQDALAAKVGTMESAKIATFQMNVINNYNNTIDNVEILGRTLFTGNTEVDSGIDLGTNTNMPLASLISANGIDPSKIEIYYSENANATKDLSLATNGWTNTPQDLSKVKSYLMVSRDYEIKTAEAVNFSYNVIVPENMDYNQVAVSDYVVYFNNNLASGTISDKEISTIFGLSTGSGPILEATLTSDTEESVELIQDDLVTLTLTVTNTGTETAENVTATVNLPSGLRLVSEESFNIQLGNVEAGASITKEITLIATSGIEDRALVETSVVVNANNTSGELEALTVKNTILKTYYNTSTALLVDEVVKEGEEFQYYIGLVSDAILDEETGQYIDGIDDTTLEIQIPQELEYKSVEVKTNSMGTESDITNSVNVNYNILTRKLKINLGKVDSQLERKVYINFKVNNLENEVYDKLLTLDTTLSGRNVRSQRVNLPNVEIGKPGLKITQSSTIPNGATISAGEDFKYTFEIENLSNLTLRKVKITDILPNELKFSGMVITFEDGNVINRYTKNNNEEPETTINITPKEKVIVEVKVNAKSLENTTQITNVLKAEYDGMDEVVSNSISHNILKVELDPQVRESETPYSPSNDKKRITGVVWVDENKDGTKQETEQKLKGIEVLLFNNVTGNVVTNSSGNPLISTTDENGLYTFTNIAQGKYTLIFLYDSANYSATTYHKQGVDDSQNSDAIDAEITINGIKQIAGITEEIAVSYNNIYNIDLGLVEDPKFDLKLDKTVSKITVLDSTGTTVTEYNDSKLAKKDIVGKKVNDTTIMVEYKIAVTNEGAISGIVKKIVDYIPDEMKFNSELNSDWYTLENGKVYNSSLANTIINPGETKEVTIVLTKKLTEDTLGLINNTAEIYESYNDLGLKDTDSTNGNRAANEDDLSSADILITVKTGETISIIAISVGIIAAIALSAYIIKKKVLR